MRSLTAKPRMTMRKKIANGARVQRRARLRLRYKKRWDEFGREVFSATIAGCGGDSIKPALR